MSSLETRLNNAVTLTESLARKLSEVINGGVTETVVTDGGNVRTVANAIALIESSAGSGSSESVNGLPDITGGLCAFNGGAFIINNRDIIVWGQGGNRVLGIGSTATSNHPIHTNLQLNVGETVTKFLRGYTDNIVLTSTGRVFGWGRNSLGIYAVSNSSPIDVTEITQNILIPPESGETVIDVALSPENNSTHPHAVYLKSDGEIITAGSNNFGQLGTIGVSSSSSGNRPTVNNSNYTRVFVARGVTFAITNNEELFGCGQGTTNGSSTSNVFTMTSVIPNANGISKFSCSSARRAADTDLGICAAISRHGQVRTWGNNMDGQLGLGNNNNQSTPQGVTDLLLENRDVFCIGGDRGNIYVLKNNYDIYAAGNGSSLQLGRGDNTSNSNVFVNMSFGTLGVFGSTLGSPIIQVLPFGEQENLSIAVLTEDGQLWACGHNTKGNLGIGTNTNTGVFTRVSFSNGKITKIGCVGNSNADVSLCLITDEGLYWQTGSQYTVDFFVVFGAQLAYYQVASFNYFVNIRI